MEVVVVLVIAAIIAAFAVPGITNYLDNARRTRQEDTVRLLYSAAQNKLTYLSANDPEGKYTDFRALFEDDSITIAGTKYEGRGTGPEGTPVVLDVVRKIGKNVGDELGDPIDNDGNTADESNRIAAYSALYQTDAPETNGAKAVQALMGESGLYNMGYLD